MASIKQVLVINPGSTSTKIAVFDELNNVILNETIRHKSEEIERFHRIIDQYEFRVDTIMSILKKHGIDPSCFKFVVGRGGLLKPLSGGTWKVNSRMIEDLKKAERGEHASNLGALIAYDIASKYDMPAYIVDPVVVDELDPIARISGIPNVERTSIFHALNQKAIARKTAADIEKKYHEASIIVAHLGGGVTVGAHKNGRVIDVNNGLAGEGPFSPERCGGLPAESIVDMCFSGKYEKDEIIRFFRGRGGLKAYFGTADVQSIYAKAEGGDSYCRLILDAMIYQIAKEIGAMATVLDGKVDAIAITGGIAYCSGLMQKLSDKVKFIAQVMLYPGEDEMTALFEGAMLSEKGLSPMHEYA